MRAAVLGSPIAHSLSPALHRAAYAALGLDWSYDALEVAAGELEAFLDGLDGEWAGLSLTMPLKQEVLPLLTDRSRVVELTGAANTVLLKDGRVGANTDVLGIVAAFRELGLPKIDRAGVIGAGATAASALVALHDLGAHHVRVVARSLERAKALQPVADALGITLRFGSFDPLELEDGWPQAIVSTAPAGALDDFAAAALPDAVPLLDVVYAPWPTPLSVRYAEAGAPVASGARMLLHQAAAQVELMTGRPAPLGHMAEALP